MSTEDKEWDNEHPTQGQDIDEREARELEDSSDIEQPVQDEVKSKAKKFGHLSKEDFIARGGKAENYKNEEEFVKYGEDYSTVKPVLDSLKKQLDRKEKEIEAILEYQKRTAEREYARARQEVEASLQQAKNLGDIDRVEALSQEKAKLDIAKQNDNLAAQKAAQQEAVDEFLSRNNHWFNKDHPDLMEKAQQVDIEVRQDYPNITHKELARRVENRMRDLYPDVVGRGNVQRPVMNASRSAVAKSSVENGRSDDDIKLFKKICAENPQYKYMYDAQKRLMEKGFKDLKGKEVKPKYTERDFINQLRKDREI